MRELVRHSRKRQFECQNVAQSDVIRHLKVLLIRPAKAEDMIRRYAVFQLHNVKWREMHYYLDN